MRILLATDGSPFSNAAVEAVANRPWPANTEVKIVSVAEPPTFPVVETWVPTDGYIEDMQRLVEEQAEAVVNRAAVELRNKQGNNLTVTTEIIVGHPRYVITDEADKWCADLIVVGSHGYRGLTRLWLGSVSQTVASHANCSVEIVRKK